MNKENSLGIIIILGIVALGLIGGSNAAKNTSDKSLIKTDENLTTEQKQANIAREITTTKQEVTELQKKLNDEEYKKSLSPYSGQINIYYVNRGADASQEYVTMQVNSQAKLPISVTGWKIKSLSTGNSITIPKASYLYFQGQVNSEENVFLIPGDLVYIVTGSSPNGASFRINKCSGYLSQFQTFTPYISTYCPAPRDEDISSIPKSPNNDACLDYINSFPNCRIQTENLPTNWSYECTNFISKKINYPSCVETHRGDADFYKPEWRIFLKHTDKLWKDRRESLVLYDNQGKIVSTLEY